MGCPDPWAVARSLRHEEVSVMAESIMVTLFAGSLLCSAGAFVISVLGIQGVVPFNPFAKIAMGLIWGCGLFGTSAIILLWYIP